MKITHTLQASLLGILCVALAAAFFINFSSQVDAVPPPGYSLYDANDIYLGQVLGANTTGGGVHYVTYLEDINGILQLTTEESGCGLFGNCVSSVHYDQENCQGRAYIDGDFIRPWIVRSAFNGVTYKIASTTSEVNILSFSSGETCFQEIGPATLYRLHEVTLPFDVNAVALPFKVKN